MKMIVALALVSASLVAQARVVQPETVKSYEVGMAEARSSIARAKSAKELAKLLSQYQNGAFKNCRVSFYLQKAGDYVWAPVEFARNFGWGIVVGKEIIRRQYNIAGSRIEQSYTLGRDTVVGMFEETENNYNGEFGACTMSVNQIKLVQEAIAKMGANVDTVVKQPNGEDTPLVIIEPGSQKH